MNFFLNGPSVWARSINQKFQPEVWHFTVKPASDMQSGQNRENFYIAFIFRHNFVRPIKFRKHTSFWTHVKEEIRVSFNFLLFFNQVYKFASYRFCKQKAWREKICNARERLPGNYGPLINQSERAYYRSHIINRYKPYRCVFELHFMIIENCKPYYMYFNSKIKSLFYVGDTPGGCTPI